MNEKNIAKLINNTGYKYSRSFTFSDTNTNKIYYLDQSLNLNEEYVFTLKLDRFLAWETVVNIDNTKNKLRYSPDNGVNWTDITIPKGIRSIASINNLFKEQMKNNGHYNSAQNTYYINFETDKSSNRVLLKISNNYKVNFNIPNSINIIFGFEKKIYSNGKHVAENAADITSSEAIYVIIDLIEPNLLFYNGEVKYLQYVRNISLYTRQLNHRTVIEDQNPTKYKLMPSKYNANQIRITLIDEDGKILDFSGERFTITFTIEST